jgi:hypothetical protein
VAPFIRAFAPHKGDLIAVLGAVVRCVLARQKKKKIVTKAQKLAGGDG